MVPISAGAGLGHRFGEVVFGVLLAERTNSTFILHETSLYGSGSHGSYSWFRSFLPLSKTEYTWAEYQSKMATLGIKNTVQKITFDEIPNGENHSQCNIFLSASSRSCCVNNQIKDNCWCFTALYGAYDQIQWRLKEAHALSTFQTTLDVYDGLENKIIVAWHIRTGDRTLHRGNKAYFETITSQIVALSVGIPLEIFFIGENVKTEFSFLESICFNHSKTCTYPKMKSDNSFYHLVHSDVLITSGSSFAYAAAMFHEGIVLNAIPKERWTRRHF